MAKIVFKINGKLYEVDGKFGPDVSLNEYIRNVADLRGTKAMCHEGGCGACVVAVTAALPPNNEDKTFAVNSCLVSVLSCHGWEVTTVEGIGNRTKGYHDIQTRLAKFNGTQCGYCTPGWIMNMYCLHKTKKLTMKDLENSFAGNLCRCTGYRPIADAFKTFATDVDQRLTDKLVDLEDFASIKPCGVLCKAMCPHKQNIVEVFGNKNAHDDNDDEWCVLKKVDSKMITIDCGDHKWFKAYDLKDVFKAISESDDYKVIAGNTGQGVYHVTEYPKNVIDIFNVAELKGYTIDVNLVLGAGMPLSEMMEVFQILSRKREEFAYLDQFYEHMDLVAHIPVRNAPNVRRLVNSLPLILLIGTIGGNLFLKYTNNDFQSDIFLLFELVGAMVVVADGGKEKKCISLMDFLKMDMKKKIIVNVMLPPLSNNFRIKTYKIMPRSQNAHAVVNAGFLFKYKTNSNIIEKATIVYGSISDKCVHATKTESVLIGKDPFTNEVLQQALKNLSKEILPEEAPPEPSGAYRKMLAMALYYKIIKLTQDTNLVVRLLKEILRKEHTQIFDTDKSIWPLNKPIPKLEALVQCSGEAVFANDMLTQSDEVFAAFVTADVKPGSIIQGFDTTEAFKIPGVISFYDANNIPGDNSFTPTNVPLILLNEEILCSKEVKYYGEPAGIIVTDREKTAVKAAKLVKIKYASINKHAPVLTIDDVLKSPDMDKRVTKDRVVEPTDRGTNIKTVLSGELKLETQHHFYMEPQTCVVKPTEDGMEVYSSTQWLDLTNVAIAQCLNVPVNRIQRGKRGKDSFGTNAL